jgi:hypothetical protein
MPRAPARIRKRYIEGQTEVLDFESEECLLWGASILGAHLCPFRTLDQWQAAWKRWGSVILPKCIEYLPGQRPVAQYVVGEIPQRELRMPLPHQHCFEHLDVRCHGGRVVRHWLNVSEPFMENEASHLRRLGIVDDAELKRYRKRLREPSGCGYPLEMSLYE